MFPLLKTTNWNVVRVKMQDGNEWDEKAFIQSEKTTYVIVQTDPNKPETSERLTNIGYRFHDRLLCFEIATKQQSGFKTTEDILFIPGEIDDDLYRLARIAFVSDRRFHLDHLFNQMKADDNIDAYINACKKERMKAFRVKHGSELLGFIVIDNQAERYYENVLGATIPGIKGKMTANDLYRGVLNYYNMRRYRGWVSSSNLYSMNMHFKLGGIVTDIVDEYIIRYPAGE